jgi:S-adenosylmethionine:tRNA ribosyltransferase-isomerase
MFYIQVSIDRGNQRNVRLDDFDYELPEDLIAQEPSAKRETSRLMVLQRGESSPPEHVYFTDITRYLRRGDLLVLNDTKVFPARVQAHKVSGGKVELLFVERSTADNLFVKADESETIRSQCLDLTAKCVEGGELWFALSKSSRPLRPGMRLELPENKTALIAARIDKSGGYLLWLDPSLSGEKLFVYLDRVGEMPLPPYIDPQKSETAHEDRYQTVFARNYGAVAAPTAGLHWSTGLLDHIEQCGVNMCWLTLHVGLGTFLPVRAEKIAEHKMHSEFYNIPEQTIDLWRKTRHSGGRVIAVGTTSLRALEAATQQSEIPVAGSGRTSIFIYPGYRFRSVDGLITNFHLPRSTLLMLVAAFHGRSQILSAYREAIQERYRFYSYGDAMLII